MYKQPENLSMTRTIALYGLGLLSMFVATDVRAKPRVYVLPQETSAVKSGPNSDLVQSLCTGCHSADYIETQPSGANFGQVFWQAEVTKMIKAYGASIEDADVKKIVDYLAKTYGTAP